MRILIIEDDVDLCETVRVQLFAAGYEVDCCHDGEDGLYFARQKAHDIILLDRMLPGMDGVRVLQSLRADGVTAHVIMVTALNGVSDRVDGLDAGADDYIVKPFAMPELLARIRAVSRRPSMLSEPNGVVCGDATLDLEHQSVKCGGEVVKLSRREAQLMELFFRQQGNVLKRSQIIAGVWGIDADIEEGNLDNYIHFLRRRLKQVNSQVRIKTIHGTGYMLEQAQEVANARKDKD